MFNQGDNRDTWEVIQTCITTIWVGNLNRKCEIV